MSAIPRIRVLSLGNCGVGKSCLIKRYCEQRFVHRYMPTVGIDYGSTTVDVNGRKVSIHFFDTSGNQLYQDVRSEFYQDMQGILLMYDVTNRASFLALDAWMTELKNNLGQSGLSQLVVLVVGTRSDTSGSSRGRVVSDAEGSAWAVRHRAMHLITSAALGTGVNNAFMTLFTEALQFKENPTPFHAKPTGVGEFTAGSHTNGTGQATTVPSATTTPNVNTANSKKVPPSKPEEAADAEAMAAINRLLNASDNFQKMQLNRRTVNKNEVNKAYRRLASLVHPDKCKAPRAEEAFKMLTQARNAVLTVLTETAV